MNAKRKASEYAASWLQSWLDAGWPWEMVDDGDPPESEEELRDMDAEMREIIWKLREAEK